MDRQQRLSANIWKLQVWELLRWFLVMMPIFIPFMVNKGLSLPEIFSLQAVFAILVFALEVPSGYFADVVGRKHSMIVGSGLMILGPILYALGESYWIFVLAEGLWGMGVAFNSGAKEALLYDSLAELGREQEYLRLSGRLQAWGKWSEGVAALAAGVLVLISFSAPFWATSSVYMIALILALSLVEPKRVKVVQANMKHLLHVFIDTVHRNRALKWIVAFAVVSSIGTRIAVWLYQPLFIETGINIEYFGILWASTLFVVGIGAWIAHHVDGTIGRHRALVLTLILAMIGYVGIFVVSISVALLLIFVIQLSRGLREPLVSDEVNALAGSDRRATVFSILSFLHQLIYAPLIILVGFAAVGGVQPVFGMLAVGIGVLGALTLTFALVFHRSRIRV